MTGFSRWFEALTGYEPHAWQADLGNRADCSDRLIRVPTGMGKTLGVLATWLYYRVARNDDSWPRRLLWCLPMRVLVEQTAQLAHETIEGSELEAGSERPPVHVLMGGENSGFWYLEPECPAVLVGTQDMLLSRALNRGYASGRARWPVEFGLLNHDALWIMDEVQLMDVGLATSAQLQAFRTADAAKALRPCHTWWMSATLQPDWLRSVDTADIYSEWTRNPCVVPPAQRSGSLWDVSKPLSTDVVSAASTDTFTKRILSEHEQIEESKFGRITLVVCNTVERANATHAALRKAGRVEGLELVHSRFRATERASWRERFLSRAACPPDADKILVVTQVIEAGVDISAGCLVTELAPWPSLVQRFGRAARYGGVGRVVVIDRGQEEKSALPYQPDELGGAWEALQSLADVGLAALDAFEDGLDSERRARLYPYDPKQLLMRDEFEELFDTTADLTGADVDISRFIRSDDERDLQVFWAEIPDAQGTPPPDRQPAREEFCAVPFLLARDWLCGRETKSDKKPRLRAGMRAWIWDWIDGKWDGARRDTLLPGRVVCVDAKCGGYTPTTGFSPDSKETVVIVPAAGPTIVAPFSDAVDNQQDGEPLSVREWKTIAFHSSEVEQQVTELSQALNVPGPLSRILRLAAHWHDIGKSHPAFQGKIRDAADEPRPDRNDIAKGPDSAWIRPFGRYTFPDDSEERPGFRHELASTWRSSRFFDSTRPGIPRSWGPGPRCSSPWVSPLQWQVNARPRSRSRRSSITALRNSIF